VRIRRALDGPHCLPCLSFPPIRPSVPLSCPPSFQLVQFLPRPLVFCMGKWPTPPKLYFMISRRLIPCVSLPCTDFPIPAPATLYHRVGGFERRYATQSLSKRRRGNDTHHFISSSGEDLIADMQHNLYLITTLRYAMLIKNPPD
jgi:hypothetical protein